MNRLPSMYAIASAWVAALAVACGSSASAPGDDTKDDVGTGGTSAGGTKGSGGTTSATDAGGATATGGRSAAGGSTSSGGGAASGGHSGTGGSTAPGDAGPLVPGVWVNATGNLANMSSVCGNLYRVWAGPGSAKTLAGVSRVGIYATTDGGATWDLEGGSTTPTNDQNSITFDPENPAVYWVAGMHTGPGIYETRDDGGSFSAIGGISNIDCVSVDFTDPARKTMVAGAHEQHIVYKSTDGGASFVDITSSFPDSSEATFAPIVIDASHYVMGTTGGVYYSSDAGGSWSKEISEPVGNAGLKTSWGPMFYTSGNGGKVIKGSADGGTWQTLPLANAVVYGVVVELPGKRIAALAQNGAANAVFMSADEGATWSVVADKIPAPNGWSATSSIVAYSAARGAFFVSSWDCASAVHPDAIWRYDVVLP